MSALSALSAMSAIWAGLGIRRAGVSNPSELGRGRFLELAASQRPWTRHDERLAANPKGLEPNAARPRFLSFVEPQYAAPYARGLERVPQQRASLPFFGLLWFV
jgi:hypothetical protein